MTEETYRRLMLKHAWVQTAAMCRILEEIVHGHSGVEKGWEASGTFEESFEFYELEKETEEALKERKDERPMHYPIVENPQF